MENDAIHPEGNIDEKRLETTTAEDVQSSVNSWIPVVEEPFKPVVGMIFLCFEEAELFYLKYASEGGFQVRRGMQKTNKNNELIWKRFLCNKEGVRDTSRRDQDALEKRRRLDTRENCGAKIEFRKNEDKSWCVSKFFEEHTHPFCTPKKRHLQKTHRSVNNSQKSLIQTFTSCNISTTHTVSVMGDQAGGLEFMGCTERDVRNIKRDIVAELECNDVQSLLGAFEQRKEENSSFFYEYVLEEGTNKLLNLFWADATQRMDYMYFRDVVVFDTTYLTNRYSLPFSAFTGVNHHGQSIYLGQAFLHNELADTYIWLFKTWIKAMPGPPPDAIVTDQDRSIAKAIREVIPNTYHRLCIWHITTKVPEKVGHVIYNKEKFSYKFHNCVKHSETPEDFEGKWISLMDEYGLKDNEWLNEIYEMRASWVTAYMKDIFFAGITSSQRSESQHSALKHYVSPHSSFSEFFMRFDTANRRMKHNEKEADYNNFVGKPRLKTSFGVEKEMANTYTLFIFYKFQEQICQSLFYIHKIEKDDEFETVYLVKKFENDGVRHLKFNKMTSMASCSCKMLEFDGIPCRHILYIFRQLDISVLPDSYIKKRWTKKAKEGAILDVDGCQNGSNTKNVESIQFMCQLGEINKVILKQGSASPEAFELAEKGLLQILEQLSALNITSGATIPFSQPSSVIVQEPDQARHKGCGSRIKGGREKAMPKPRVCHGCNRKNVNHDKRNCPALKGNNGKSNSEGDAIDPEKNDDTRISLA